MNLNDVIQDIPTVIRGRFAGNANAAWIRWAGQTISRINEAFPGLGRVRKTPVRLMKSGFIRNPGHLRQISNIFVDGQEVKFVQQLNGAWLDGDDLTEKGLAVSATEYPATADSSTGEAASLVIDATYMDFVKDIPASVTCTIEQMGDPGVQQIVNILDLVGAASTDLVGRSLISGGVSYRILAVTPTIPGKYQLDIDAVHPAVPANTPLQQITGMADDALAGWSFAADSDFFEIIGSQWVKPISTPSGWTADPRNSVDFKEPAREFAAASGAIYKSNVVGQGYGLLKRPTSMTEELDLPDEYLPLLATGMRLKAELDMAPASADAGAVMALFEKDLRRYANDNQNADGNSVKRAFNCSPRLGRYSR